MIPVAVQPKPKHPAGIPVLDCIGEQIRQHPVQCLFVAHDIQRLIRELNVHFTALGIENFVEGEDVSPADLPQLHP
ncbi:hypothetical protein D3C75_1325350 [compost metagenome]